MKKSLLFSLMVIGAVAVMITAATSAVFTDTATTSTNTFTTGTLDISASTPATFTLPLDGLAPGDVVNSSITVTNLGSLQLRYAMTTAVTNSDATFPLTTQLTFQIKTVGAGCLAFDGTSIYSGSLTAAVIGLPAAGPDAGDRPLAASGSEVLCLRATLPGTAGNDYQGDTGSAIFTFSAEQTRNNP